MLFPRSCSRTAIDRLCSLLSPDGERYGVSTFRVTKFVGLGACNRPGSMLVTSGQIRDPAPTPSTFWFKRNSHFRLFELTIFTQIQISSPCRLSSTSPACGCQKDAPLAIYIPRLAAPRFIVRVAALFRPIDSPGDTGGSVHTSAEQLHRATSCRTSGSPTQLPAPSPLRTVHATFAAHGSSLYKGIFRYPVSLLKFPDILMIPTAIEMVHSKITRYIRSAIGSFHNKANIPWIVLCDWFLTVRTQAILH